MYVEREIKNHFLKVANTYPLIALVGARQSGKTTFLKEHLKTNGNYLLFDDPDIRHLFDEDIKKFEIQYLKNSINVLDEVQYCKNPGLNLKYLVDTGRKLWITSSSEVLLSKKVFSYLVGRVSIIKLYPFSLNEFLKAKNQIVHSPEVLNRNIWEHVIFGGYPKVVETQDIELKKTILRDLYETMILKDVAKVFSIENINSLEIFVKYLSSIIGGILSYDTLSNDLGLSFQTVKKYLDGIEKSYIIKRITPFYKNKLKEIKKQPKLYFIDTGLRNLIQKKFSGEIEGQLFENYVFSELLKAGFEPKYWRTKTGQEVDFILEIEKGIIPIEVKLSSHEKIKSGLKAFIDTYSSKRAYVVCYNREARKEKFKDTEIKFCNILELLEELKK